MANYEGQLQNFPGFFFYDTVNHFYYAFISGHKYEAVSSRAVNQKET